MLSMLASGLVKSTFAKYSQVHSLSGITGKTAAEHILQMQGIHDVRVEHISGNLTDHYDPSSKVSFLLGDDNLLKMKQHPFAFFLLAALLLQQEYHPLFEYQNNPFLPQELFPVVFFLLPFVLF